MAASAIVALTHSGCSESDSLTNANNEVPANVATAYNQASSQTSSTKAIPPTEQLPAAQEQQSDAPGLLERAGKLLNDAKQVTGDQASGTGQWLKGALEGANESTGSAVDGSLDWANQTFKSLKDQGLTTASSTGEWLSEDWQNMESWQYKVLPASSVPAEELEAKLNELGKEGWECFSVDDQKLIFKRAPESYLKRLPFKDILRLAPLLKQMNQ